MAQYTSHDGSYVYICNNKRTVGNGIYVQYAMVDASLCNMAAARKDVFCGVHPKALSGELKPVFLGDINTGTWPSRLGESQMRQ
jgi:hypothetical protein